jgi:hypothetical protein
MLLVAAVVLMEVVPRPSIQGWAFEPVSAWFSLSQTVQELHHEFAHAFDS